MKTIKTGLIGFGPGGNTFHAPVIHAVKGLELYKIRARKPEQVKLAKERYPDAIITGSSDDIINDDAIELVVIATPNDSHFSLAKQALQAGKHVVVDKPFTITTEDADALIQIAKEENRILSVHHNRRFDGDFFTVQKLISDKVLGRLVEFESHYDRFRNYLRPGAWREEDIPGAGILYDLGTHLIDQPMVLFGLPEAITADVRVQRSNAKATDNFELIFHYKDNLKVTLKAGMLVSQPLPHYIILGEDGSYLKYNLDVQEEALKAGVSPLDDDNWGVEPEENYGTLVTYKNGERTEQKVPTAIGDYRLYYQNIYDAITGKAALTVTAVHARNIIKLVELAIQSSNERRTIDCKEAFIENE